MIPLTWYNSESGLMLLGLELHIGHRKLIAKVWVYGGSDEIF